MLSSAPAANERVDGLVIDVHKGMWRRMAAGLRNAAHPALLGLYYS